MRLYTFQCNGLCQPFNVVQNIYACICTNNKHLHLYVYDSMLFFSGFVVVVDLLLLSILFSFEMFCDSDRMTSVQNVIVCEYNIVRHSNGSLLYEQELFYTSAIFAEISNSCVTSDFYYPWGILRVCWAQVHSNQARNGTEKKTIQPN